MAYIQTEVPTNPCDETNDDDEFGEFTSAVSLTPSSTGIQSGNQLSTRLLINVFFFII